MRFLLVSILLLSGFSVFAQAHADCVTALNICEKKKLTINAAGGIGANQTEADFIACFMSSENRGQAEENSTWLRFEIAESGTLTFTITPHKADDDIDFVVYRSLDGTCNNMKIVRCNAAGDPSEWSSHSNCLGKTGLRNGETDTSEDAGCFDTDDNAWLAPLNVQKGEKYVILISNVTTRGPGFDIVFGGTAFLPCEKIKPVAAAKPKPDKPKPAAAVAAKPAAPPETIGGRRVEIKEDIAVKNRNIKVTIWDSQVQDGDIVSVYLNDKKVIDRVYLTQKPHEYELQLPAGREHFLTVYADDFGKSGGVNTARVTIDDGIREQTIDLAASRSSQQSIRIVKE
jgi:hypothetical protein